MAGGAFFVFILLLISTSIALVWLFKGYGEIRKKVLLTGAYLACTIVPASIIGSMAEVTHPSALLSDISFLLFTLAILYGFILPIFSKHIIRGN